MHLIDSLVPLITILSCIALPIGFGMYLGLTSIRAKNQENMEMLKQGIIPPPSKSSSPNKYSSLRNGFLCIGIGIGLVVGMVLVANMDVSLQNELFLIAAPVLIFLGLSYVLFYLVTKDKSLDNE